jgi:phospholipase C
MVTLAGCHSHRPGPAQPLVAGPSAAAASAGITKIKHVVFITQENRSFDSYFGTFPGADGIPRVPHAARPCLPTGHGGCVRPFHDRTDVDGGGPHDYRTAEQDIAGGSMDGFVKVASHARRQCFRRLQNPACSFDRPADVMGYHDAREIPNYWSYARHFVLQDHMFEPVRSWSLPAHLFQVSGWSAYCPSHQVSSCRNARDNFQSHHLHTRNRHQPVFAWTDLTYLLHRYGVSWRYYVQGGAQPDCTNSAAIVCRRVLQSARTPSIWNPLPDFDTVHADGQLGDIQPTRAFLRATHTGTLPAVSWVVPSQVHSEHPPARVSDGQAFVTRLVDAVMRGPDWSSTAIFLSWDDWGGFYDHVRPPRIDHDGYGLRVPGLVISPYAYRGYVDHQLLSPDAYLAFIEDRWLHGQRLDPRTDGRPDPRPDVRENVSTLGNLLADFDFRRRPRPPLILPTRPHTDLVEPAGYPSAASPCTGKCAARGVG